MLSDSVIVNFLLFLTVNKFENRPIFYEVKTEEKYGNFWATLYTGRPSVNSLSQKPDLVRVVGY